MRHIALSLKEMQPTFIWLLVQPLSWCPFLPRKSLLAPGVPSIKAAGSQLADISSCQAPTHRNVFWQGEAGCGSPQTYAGCSAHLCRASHAVIFRLLKLANSYIAWSFLHCGWAFFYCFVLQHVWGSCGRTRVPLACDLCKSLMKGSYPLHSSQSTNFLWHMMKTNLQNISKGFNWMFISAKAKGQNAGLMEVTGQGPICFSSARLSPRLFAAQVFVFCSCWPISAWNSL